MAFLLLFGISIGAATLLTIALHLPHMTRSGMTPGGLLLQEGLGVLAVLAAAAIMGQMEGRPFGVYGLPVSEAFGARFWQGAAWGIAMITATILLIRLFGGFSFGDLALHGIDLWRYAILWGLGFVCVGLFEEFLFRGYAQYTLSTGIPFWRAAALLSAGFGAIHLSNAGEDKIGALSVFVIAMFFCFTLRRTGNLWFAVGLHAAFDWGETFLFSVPDSGIVASGHMLNSSFHGPAWLTGGTVGPEGSMMVFVVVGLTAVIFSRVYPQREKN
jgi:membrane protease YdiL (CAAX protease family)